MGNLALKIVSCVTHVVSALACCYTQNETKVSLCLHRAFRTAFMVLRRHLAGPGGFVDEAESPGSVQLLKMRNS